MLLSPVPTCNFPACSRSIGLYSTYLESFSHVGAAYYIQGSIEFETDYLYDHVDGHY